MNRLLTLALTCSALALVACSGAGDIGDECGTPGGADECVDGAVCHDRNSGDAPGVCRLSCSDDTDCAAGESCEDVSGIDGDVKGCV